MNRIAKKCYTAFIALLFLTVILGNSSDSNTVELLKQSLQKGQAHQLSMLFDKQIELVIESETVDFPSVSANHAELILQSFFRKHPPRRFQYIYQGNTTKLRYSTGIYETQDQAFSVYVLMRQDARRQLVINTLHVRKNK